jgi:O-antigen ligase
MIEHPLRYRLDRSQNRYAMICLILFCILLVLVTISWPLNIFLSGPSVIQREEVNPILNFVLFPISFLLLVLNVILLKPRFSNRDFINLFVMLLLVVAYIFSCVEMGNGARPSLLILGVWATIILSSYCTFRFIPIHGNDFSWIFRYTYIFISLLIVSLGYYFVKYDMIIYITSNIFAFGRPQIGELFQSTELSNLLACILLFAPVAWISCKNKVSKLIVIIATLPILFLFIIMGSLGSYITILCVIIFFVPIRRSLKISFTIFVFAIIVAVLLNVYFESLFVNISEFNEKIAYKFTYDRRISDYAYIWEMIKERPFIGNGVKSIYNQIGLYPHNNILGIWAELGFIVLLTYLINFFLCIIYCLRIRTLFIHSSQKNNFVKILMCFSMITLFLYLKGFVHDTWQDWSLWLSFSSMLGLASNPSLFDNQIQMNTHLVEYVNGILVSKALGEGE